MIAIVCKFVDGGLKKKESNEQQASTLQDLIGRCKYMSQQKPEDDEAEKDVEITETKTQE